MFILAVEEAGLKENNFTSNVSARIKRIFFKTIIPNYNSLITFSNSSNSATYNFKTLLQSAYFAPLHINPRICVFITISLSLYNEINLLH